MEIVHRGAIVGTEGGREKNVFSKRLRLAIWNAKYIEHSIAIIMPIEKGVLRMRRIRSLLRSGKCNRKHGIIIQFRYVYSMSHGGRNASIRSDPLTSCTISEMAACARP